MAEPLYPHPPQWRVITLEPKRDGFIEAVVSGGTPATGVASYWDGTIPWLTPKEIARGRSTLTVSSTERCISQLGLTRSAARLLAPGTVLLTKRAPVGAVAINAVPMATNQGFMNFRTGSELRPEFLAYWFEINTAYLQRVANGSTYPELYLNDLFEFELAVPSLDEQDRILVTIRSVQFAIALGVPLEQMADSSSKKNATQEESRMLAEVKNRLIVGLVSGMVSTTDLRRHDNVRSALVF